MNKIIEELSKIDKPYKIMEVCGTHTYEIMKNGIKDVLPNSIELISGPGCPVCVIGEEVIDYAVEFAYRGFKIVTFGDVLKIKGSTKSLMDCLTEGYDVKVIYSVYDLLVLSKQTSQNIIFLAVGFETTSPVIASIIKEMDQRKISNVHFLFALKRMEPVINKTLELHADLDGVICPGHVAVITGAHYFKFMKEKVSTVICGFEAMDILAGIYYITQHPQGFSNLYKRIVTDEGNLKAKSLLNEVFDVCDENWRGIGVIKDSGYKLSKYYEPYDALLKYQITTKILNHPTKCSCQDIIMGLKKPTDCPLFKESCNPKHPIGPCMTSSEGACLIYYQFRRLT